jgi:hypothetical protein
VTRPRELAIWALEMGMGGGNLTTDARANRTRFVAGRWERDMAEKFINWRSASGEKLRRMHTFADAISRTLREGSKSFVQPDQLACKLGAALRHCDILKFDDGTEACAYAGLHLLDRYGRVNQVLEYLIRIGRLPLRVHGARVLEVGSGPAPAAYAARDFYAELRSWPGAEGVVFGNLAVFHTLERGRAWDLFLNRLSET